MRWKKWNLNNASQWDRDTWQVRDTGRIRAWCMIERYGTGQYRLSKPLMVHYDLLISVLWNLGWTKDQITWWHMACLLIVGQNSEWTSCQHVAMPAFVSTCGILCILWLVPFCLCGIMWQQLRHTSIGSLRLRVIYVSFSNWPCVKKF